MPRLSSRPALSRPCFTSRPASFNSRFNCCPASRAFSLACCPASRACRSASWARSRARTSSACVQPVTAIPIHAVVNSSNRFIGRPRVGRTPMSGHFVDRPPFTSDSVKDWRDSSRRNHAAALAQADAAKSFAFRIAAEDHLIAVFEKSSLLTRRQCQRPRYTPGQFEQASSLFFFRT